ncbi:hypothetical protein [Streptomyces sp. NPDC017964]|uniref:hypothetical protein n=1 Tax=Streptomyces sp. NPDC017964 TaxID=3365022 RepID=UPI0037942008
MGLRRAIADLLRGNSGRGIPARSPEQVIARMNRCWYQGRGPERSTPSYVPVPGAQGEEPIRNPSSWLAAAILQQDCPRPDCEDGVLMECGSPCPLCRERRAEERAAREAARRAVQRWQGAAVAQQPDRSALAAAREEERVRQVLREAGVFGELLEHRVRAHMTTRAAGLQVAGRGAR